jgi:hypothetical protein
MRTRITLAILVIVATTTASAAASSPHRERFTLSGTTIHGTERPIKVTAIGSIHGTGTARFIEHRNTSDGTFYLPDGKLFIAFVGTRSVSHRHPRACTATVQYQGTFTITGGTRHYRHAAGTGTFTEHRKYIGQRDNTGRCLPKAPPATITAVNHARGTASI